MVPILLLSQVRNIISYIRKNALVQNKTHALEHNSCAIKELMFCRTFDAHAKIGYDIDEKNSIVLFLLFSCVRLFDKFGYNLKACNNYSINLKPRLTIIITIRNNL